MFNDIVDKLKDKLDNENISFDSKDSVILTFILVNIDEKLNKILEMLGDKK